MWLSVVFAFVRGLWYCAIGARRHAVGEREVATNSALNTSIEWTAAVCYGTGMEACCMAWSKNDRLEPLKLIHIFAIDR